MKITIIRHGMTEKRLGGQDDLDRPLTKKCEEFIPRLGEFDAVFSSPARRCIETAKLASGQNPIVINSLSTHLWNGKVGDVEGWELVEKCYYMEDGSMAEIPLAMAWKNISTLEQEAWEIITNEAMNEMFHGYGYEWNDVLICTHQFHAQALAFKILGGKHQSSAIVAEFIQNLYLPPGGTLPLQADPVIVDPIRGRNGGIFF